MIKQTLDIDGYWEVIIAYDVFLGEVNSGFTHTDFNKKLSIVCIGKADSKRQFLNTIVHEAKHIQSHICRYYNVPEDGEDAAYLIGYLVMEMYKCFRKLI